MSAAMVASVALNRLRASRISPERHIAQHPQHLMPDIRLQPIQGQDDLPLRLQPGAQPVAVCQAQRHHLLVAPQLLGHRALGDRHPPRHQVLMDLRHAAVLAIAQRPHRGDDVQPELAVRQGIVAFRLRAVRVPVACTGRILAAAHWQPSGGAARRGCARCGGCGRPPTAARRSPSSGHGSGAGSVRGRRRVERACGPSASSSLSVCRLPRKTRTTLKPSLPS